MLKLKIILQSKYFIIILTFLTLILTIVRLFIIPKSSLYSIDEKNFTLSIVGINTNESGYTIVFMGKEKLISYYYNDFNYEIGDEVFIKGELSLPSKNTIPNLFNYREYLNHNNIYYILKIKDISLVQKNENILNNTKNFIIKTLNKYKSHTYLYTFILGNNNINSDIKNIYQKLGVSHLFAISGMHLSLLIMVISYILKKFNLKEWVIFIIIVIFLLYYIFLVNYQVSIIRAFLSYLLFSLNKLFKLEIKKEKVMFYLLVIMLNINPKYLYNLGFLYSYIISFSLVKFSFLIKGNYLKKLFTISFISFISSLPISLFCNYEINLLSIFYNLFYVPFISLIIFPLSLIILFVPILDNLYFFLINILENISKIFGQFNTSIVFSKPSFWLIILYYMSIFFLLKGLSLKKYKYAFPLLLVFLFHYNINFLCQNTFLTVLDVNQGDSILIHDSGKTILIDAGATYLKDYSDDLWTYFKSLGIRKINYLFITHGDFDHLGSIYSLVDKIKVDRVYFNNNDYNYNEFKIINILKKKGILYDKVSNRCFKTKNIKLCSLNNLISNDENDSSIVLYGNIHNKKVLFMGDASSESEKGIIKYYKLGHIDFLKVGHHGSNTSSHYTFIKEITPSYALISVGKNNKYHHPHIDVLNNLENAIIYRTDLDGSITIRIKKNGFKIETCEP